MRAVAELPSQAVKEFDALVVRLRKSADGPDPRRQGLGTYTLFAGSKMFGHLDDDGALVLRFPPERAVELIARGTGDGWGVEPGRLLTGYVSIPLSRALEWFELARESQTFKLEQDRKKGATRSPAAGRK